MFDSPWDDHEFSLLDPFGPIAEIHPESSLDDQEQFVLQLVLVPDELALELHELDLLAVQFADDFRAPGLGELRQFPGQADLVHNASAEPRESSCRCAPRTARSRAARASRRVESSVGS